MAFMVGVPSSRSDLPVGALLCAYTLFDAAILSLFLITLRVLEHQKSRLYRIAVYMNECWMMAKILMRIFIEESDELVTVNLTDELFYAGCLWAFLWPLAQLYFASQQAAASEPATEYSHATVSKLVGLVVGERVVLFGAFVFLVIAAISDATIPHFIGQALDAVKDGRSAYGPLLGLLAGAGGVSVFSGLRGSTFILLGSRVNVRLRSQLFEQIVDQDIGFFDKTKTGDLSSRMTQDVQKVCDQVQLNVNYFVRNLISTLVTLSFMISLSWRLTCLSMVSIPFTAVLVHKYGDIMKKISKKVQDELANCNAASEESFANVRVVRSFGAEPLEARRFRDLLDKVYKISLTSARMYVPYNAVCRMLPYLSLFVIIAYGAKLATAGVMEASVLISFILYLDMLNNSFSAMGDIYASITAALGAADKVFALLEQRPAFEQLDPPTVRLTEASKGHIQLKNVHFSYPSRPHVRVLNAISLEVKAGTVAALVGGSGQGKSSCLALLQRWYMQSSGDVLIDGMPIRKLEDYHRFVTCVNQEPLLFARSIKENILFGLLNPGDTITPELEERVVACAKLANAHQFITGLPEGYDTQVGMRGVQLSGGQKQRIAIARALVRRPKVLLLDEATSALDSESEKQVQSALDSMMTSDMTMVVVAHRLSTVRNADIIYVIDKGTVIESGTHNELVANETSAYFKLVQNQLDGHSMNGR